MNPPPRIYQLGRAECECGELLSLSLVRDGIMRCRCAAWSRITPAGPGLVRVERLTTEGYLEARDQIRRLGRDAA